MRSIALVLVAACDFQPAPPRQAPAPPPAGSAQVAPAPPAPAAPPDAAATPPPADAVAITDNCENIGVHVAQILIDGAKDATLRANYEHARPDIVRATAEACTGQHWTADAQTCFLDSKVEADVRACEKKFPPPAVQPKQPQIHSDHG